MNKLLTIVATLLIVVMPANSLASCGQPVTLLEEGAGAPCRGYLFTPEEEFKMFKLNEDHKLLQQEFDTQTKDLSDSKKQLSDLTNVVNLEQQKSELWRGKAEDSTKKLVEADDGRGKRDLLFMGLGVLLTIGAGLAVGAAAKGLHN